MDLFSHIDEAPSQKRIAELSKLIDRYNYEYYINDNSLISDYEFDALLRELIDLEKQYPQFALPNSPTKRVGGDVVKSFQHVTHRFPMLSLGNTYSIEEIIDFESRTRRLLEGMPFSYTCELKYDGVAIGLTYKDGELSMAATRGNGSVGDDITTNARTISTIPLHLKGIYPRDFEVRGEVIFPFEEFEQFNRVRQEEGEEPFANPRNAASGSLKLQDSAECAKRKLQFCPYFLMISSNEQNTITDQSLSQSLQSHMGRLNAISSMGFRVLPYTKECKNIAEIKAYIDYWDNERWNLPFAIDGIVIKVNQVSLWDHLGLTSKSPRWAIAYKFKAQQVSTPLESVSFQVGRTGVITPVANLKPVWLGGTTVKRATLVNADFIEKMDIRDGDSLLIEKGGEIIPKVVGVDLSKRKSNTQPLAYVTQCPVCGTTLVQTEGESNTYCPNSDGCKPQIIGRLEHFVARRAMNIDGLGTERLEMLYQKGLVKNIADLYDLTREQLVGIESFDADGLRKTSIQDRGADNILNAIEQSKTIPFERVVFALGIRYVGEVGAKKLAYHFLNMDNLIAANEVQLAAVDDIGPVTAKAVFDFFHNEYHLHLIEKLKSAGLQMSCERQTTSTLLVGKTFVVSGVFNHFTRDEIKANIEQNGGKVNSSISSKTSFLLAGEKMGPEKLKKASSLGIPIISEDEYLSMVNPKATL